MLSRRLTVMLLSLLISHLVMSASMLGERDSELSKIGTKTLSNSVFSVTLITNTSVLLKVSKTAKTLECNSFVDP